MAYRRLTTLILIIFVNLAVLTCSASRLPSAEILGLRIGMDRNAAREHLNEISHFIRGEGRNQELWKLQDDPRFGTVAVGYSDDKIRYVTAFVDKEEAQKPITFLSVGDIDRAKSEITAPHFRYIWDIPGSQENPACSVNVYGDNPEFVTMYTLVGRTGDAKLPEGEEEEDD